jgi:hypothetical protein
MAYLGLFFLITLCINAGENIDDDKKRLYKKMFMIKKHSDTRGPDYYAVKINHKIKKKITHINIDFNEANKMVEKYANLRFYLHPNYEPKIIKSYAKEYGRIQAQKIFNALNGLNENFENYIIHNSYEKKEKIPQNIIKRFKSLIFIPSQSDADTYNFDAYYVKDKADAHNNQKINAVSFNTFYDANEWLVHRVIKKLVEDSKVHSQH